MTRKLISILLAVIFLFSGIASTVAAAAENAAELSGTVKQTNTTTIKSGDYYDAVFYIDAVNNVQGIETDLYIVSSFFTIVPTTPYYEVNSEITGPTTTCSANNIGAYNNVPGTTGFRFSILFDPASGKSFSKKTELIRFKMRAVADSSSALVKYEVREFFESKNLSDLDKNKITCAIEPSKSNATLTGIEITTPPTKTSYYVGDALDTSGIKVTAKFSDNSTKDVTSSVSYSGFDSSSIGEKTVTVTYQGKTATFKVTVNALTVTKIEITTQPTKKSYTIGETLDTSGIKVTATYNNGTTKDVTSSVTYSGFDSSSAGEKTVTVSYQGKTTTFKVTVVALEVTKIVVTTQPKKTSYYVGDKLDTTGIQITATYNNGTTKDVTSSVTYSGFDSSSAGEKTVTVSYQGKTTTFKVTVVALEVTKIAVTTQPTKTSYYIGEKLDTTGIKITATYNNGSTKDVTSSVTYSGFDSSSAGEKTVTVTYSGKTTTFKVTVIALAVTKIAVTTPPTKTSYYIGDKLDTTGIKITATYNNGSTKDVTSSVTYSGFDSLSAGEKTVTVSYSGKTTTFKVTVIALAVTKIAVTTPPTKTSYYVGDKLDTTGIKITATYNNGSTQDVTSSVTYSGFDSSSAGEKTVTVSYSGKTTTFKVTVIALAVTKIAVTTPPTKTSYYIGDKLDTTGIKITATYNNGSTQDVTSSVTYSGFDSSSAGEKTVTVTYSGKTTTFKVTVIALAVTKIAVTTQPTKTSYYVGDKLDTTGIKITATYNNGSTKDVTSSVTYSGFDSSSAGEKTVTVTYSGKTTTFKVTVIALAVTKIAVTTQPTKTSYYVGDKLDTTGIKITATYNNGSTQDVTSSVTYSGFDSSSAGEKTVTVTYSGKTTTFKVTVIALAVTKIAVTTQPTKTSYYVGDKLDTTGIKITATYNNGSTQDVTSSVTYSGFDSSSAGEKTVTVSYSGKTTTFKVTVIALAVTKIAVITPPTKTSYYVGDKLDTTGIKITATYNNGSTQDVTSSVTYSGFDSSSAGEKTVTVTYSGKTTTFKVTVIALAVTKIAVTTPPTKTSYYVGDKLDTTGIKITATYNNGSTQDVTSSVTYSGFDSSSAGEKTVTVTYSGKTTTFKVTVIALAVTKIAVTTQPTKTSYYVGDKLDTTGIKITATYNNGSTQDVTSSVTYSGFDSSSAGEKTVTVTYSGKTTTFKVTVIALAVTKIAVTTPPTKTSYYVGDKLDTTGIKITATYNNGSTQDVTSSVTYSGFDSSSAGEKTVTVSYSGKTTTFKVTVIALAVTKIAVTTPPTKTSYYVGDKLDTTGIKITATYNNDSTKDVTSSVTYSGFDSSTAGEKIVTVAYQGKTASFKVNVAALAVTSIAVTTQPTKKSYYIGEALDTTGIKITATYNNGSTKDVTSSVTYSGFDSSTAGEKTVTVTYQGITTVFKVNVIALAVTSIAVTNQPTKTSYYVGDKLDTAGIRITATYNNGSTKDVTSSVTYSGFDSSTAGDKNVTVTYEGKTAVFTVTVKAITIKRIEITAVPSKTSYYVGETFDASGIKVIAHYNNDSQKDVSSSVTYSGFNSSTSGTKTITVTYEGKTAQFDVYILDNKVEKITITKAPDKTVYYTGEEINLSGLTVIAQYSNGSTEDVSSQIKGVRNFDNTAPGTQNVEIEYGGKTATFSVTVIKLEVERLELTPPTKTKYFVGQALDFTGMKVTAVYNNGSRKDVTADVTINGADTSTAGTKAVIVWYESKSAEFNITVIQAEVVSLDFVPPTKTEYYIGESLDLSGMMVRAHFSDGTSEIVSDKVTISGFDSTTEGVKTITVEYGSKSVSFEVTVYKKEAVLEYITVTPPQKQNYFVGETFDPNGMSVIAHYSDESTVDITSHAIITGFDATTSGEKTITVEYMGFTASFDITVYEIVLEYISVTPPQKVQYIVGESPDMTGFEATAYYSNGSVQNVTDKVSVNGFDTSSAGIKSVEVVFGDKTAYFEIIVSEKEIYLDYIEVIPPETTTYYVGESLDTTGMKVTAYYSDGSTLDVTDSVNIYGFDSSCIDTIEITVEYMGKTASFYVTIIELEDYIISLTVSPPYKTEYYIGESLDLTGMSAYVLYTDATVEDVTQYVTVSGYDCMKEGVQTITVTYQNVSDTFEVTVKQIESELMYIEVTPPSKTIYYVGEQLNTEGMTVLAYYSSDDIIDVTQSVTLTGFTSDTAGDVTVTVEYNGKTAEFTVTIIDIELVKIEVTPPDKRVYNIGESFSSDGMKVTAYYSNSETKEVYDYSVSGFDSSTEGVKTITVEYQGKTASFEITVLADDVVLESISVTPPSKTVYEYGEQLDTNGMVVMAHYSNGAQEEITSFVTITGFDSTTTGTQQITVEYQGCTAYFEVFVYSPAIINIERIEVTPPNKTVYSIGESLDLDGMIVIAYYSNGNRENVTNDCEVSGFDSTAAGTITLTVSYQGKTAEFTVTILKPEVYLDHISVVYPTKTTYSIGEAFDPTGMSVYAYYSDGSILDVTQQAEISGFDSGYAGEQLITVSYGGFSESFTVNVYLIESELLYIEIAELPYKLHYWKDEYINIDGLKVNAYYSTGEIVDVTGQVSVYGYNMYNVGEQSVTVEFENKSTEFTVYVHEIELLYIEIVPPTKRVYFVGDYLDTTGLEVRAYYSNGDIENIYYVSVTGYDNETPGIQTITVEYEGKTATFEIEVKYPAVIALEIIEPDKTVYDVGEELDLSGFMLWAIYEDGTKYYIGEKYTVTGFDSTTAGIQVITVEYEGVTIQFTVEVVPNTTILLGDVNCDGKITARDALIVLRYSIGLIKDITDDIFTAMDVDRNGKATAADALLIQRYAVGLIKEF